MKKLAVCLVAILLACSLSGCMIFGVRLNKDNVMPSKNAFEATVLAVDDTGILVEPHEGTAERSSASQIKVTVDLSVLETKPDIGDVVKITYDGNIQETYPAVISNVDAVEIAE